MRVNEILKDYTAGEADLETTNAALREAGCGEGDTVDIYGLEFDFVE